MVSFRHRRRVSPRLTNFQIMSFANGDRRGYIAIQSTRPATINFLISSNPIGLMAWIWDKLVDWSDEYPWTEDEVCLWVSLYVFARAGPDAASYIYYEALHDATEITMPVVQGYIDVPLGIADFPVEICNNPKSWRHTMVSDGVEMLSAVKRRLTSSDYRDRSSIKRSSTKEGILQAGRGLKTWRMDCVRCSAKEAEHMASSKARMDTEGTNQSPRGCGTIWMALNTSKHRV